MLRLGLSLLGWTLVFGAIIFVADGCKFAFPESCKNVTCPEGVKCETDVNYWCPGRFGGICTQVATCGQQEPCQTHRCKSGTQCVKVIDACVNGVCTMKAQCNDVVRSGTCPDPKDISIHSCMNGCDDGIDALCQAGAKCCSAVNFSRKFCVNTLESGEFHPAPKTAGDLGL